MRENRRTWKYREGKGKAKRESRIEERDLQQWKGYRIDLQLPTAQLYCLPITTINYLVNKHISRSLSPLGMIIVNYSDVVYWIINDDRARLCVSVCIAPKKGTFTVHASGAMKHCTCLELLWLAAREQSCPAATANTCSSPFFVTLNRSQDRRKIVEPLCFKLPFLLLVFSLTQRIFLPGKNYRCLLGIIATACTS